MPDNRQTSKQRRAARNRAYREALAARRENAAAEASERAPRATSSSSSSTGRAARGTATATATPGAGRPPGFSGPGDVAVLLALLLAVFFAGVSLYVAFTSDSVPVDHAGDAISSFPAVSREAYAVFHDTEIVTEKTTLVDAYGPVIPIFAVLPALVAVGAFVSHRRQPRSRPLTYALVAMALVSVFNLFAMYFLPALIALAVAGFQVRKTEAPAVRGGRRRADEDDDEVIDVDEVDPDEEDLDDEYDDEEYDEYEDEGDETVEDDDVDADEAEDADEVRAAGESEDSGDDVLADLEAEIEDEGDEGTEGDETKGDADAASGGRRRRSGGRSSGR